ncbi:hypothetical protein [Oleisolibacter albus]|uniref:hypothetical protein n=1 Tax=Oleisolibacter albus TaxID=2171757 RepID=UPI000DF31186|nr:hypothetical protein [Oleisolibacter albus]
MSLAASLETELHRLLDMAAALSDEQGLARLHQMLTCLAEGAELVEYQLDVPEGLGYIPALQRAMLTQTLLTAETAGCC